MITKSTSSVKQNLNNLIDFAIDYFERLKRDYSSCAILISSQLIKIFDYRRGIFNCIALVELSRHYNIGKY